MSNPTDSDRATAKQVIDELLDGIDHWEGDPQAFVVAGNAIAAALAAEREACACEAEETMITFKRYDQAVHVVDTSRAQIASAIRARSAAPWPSDPRDLT